MEGVLAWLGALPPAALYVILALVAATENFVPPIPADVIVAFGSFLAAANIARRFRRSSRSVIGNVGGALGMFALGRRFGAEWIRRRLRVMGEGGEAAGSDAVRPLWIAGALPQSLPAGRARRGASARWRDRASRDRRYRRDRHGFDHLVRDARDPRVSARLRVEQDLRRYQAFRDDGGYRCRCDRARRRCSRGG